MSTVEVCVMFLGETHEFVRTSKRHACARLSLTVSGSIAEIIALAQDARELIIHSPRPQGGG